MTNIGSRSLLSLSSFAGHILSTFYVIVPALNQVLYLFFHPKQEAKDVERPATKKQLLTVVQSKWEAKGEKLRFTIYIV